MITYGHQEYILQAIEGILMQEYDGEIELIISNDKSPDQTDEIVTKIIAKHVNGFWIKYFKHEVNKGMMSNFIWSLKQASGTYIAICEGDDYWIDPLKIQKQVDFLEANAEYGLVHTDMTILNNRTKKDISRSRGLEQGKELNAKDIFYALLNGEYIIGTQTVLFRAKYLNGFELKKDSAVGDVPLWIALSQVSKIKYIDQITSVYRAAFGSATRQTEVNKQLLFKIAMAESCFDLLEMYGFEVDSKTIEKYRKRVFDYKKYHINALQILHPQYFSNKELNYLISNTSTAKLIFKRTLNRARNYRSILLNFYLLFAKT